MEILPSEYQQLELYRSEKMFIRYAESCEDYGYVFLNTNPALIENEKQNIVISKDGVLILKFFDEFNDANMFPLVMGAYFESVFVQTYQIIGKKLLSNKALADNGKLLIKYNYVCVFPNINKADIDKLTLDDKLARKVKKHCMFKEQFSALRREFTETVNEFLDYNTVVVSDKLFKIDDKNVNTIVQRIAPEYTTIRISEIEDLETYTGVDNEKLVVTEDDMAVRAFMLDKEQINIVNKINKGDQLILACAGSGKSVILISKCFKAARMNPEKKFLITCYSRQLQSLYTWYIDRAGLKERNVECITFHKLCKKLADKCGCYLGNKPETWCQTVTDRYNKGQVKDRYYGIFIDEVQLFEQEWYKLCYNLLENKQSDDHLFVICGDKTQEIKKQQKRGKAPWNAGENYPNYRGGNKNIRIEKNYRNCIEINSYINGFVSCAKEILNQLPGNEKADPDLFLRGKAVRNGIGVSIRKLITHTAHAEADMIIDAIREAHDIHKIPYDEIAVVMYNKAYRKKLPGWDNHVYNLETPLLSKLTMANIPRCVMYSNNNEQITRYGHNDGVGLISFDSVLGLDFRAVIVCGLKPFGDYDKTKYLTLSDIKKIEEDSDDIDEIRKNISMLYVACTRARDMLYIIQPESAKDSMYMKLLLDAEKNYKES